MTIIRRPKFDPHIRWVSYTTRHMHPEIKERLQRLSGLLHTPMERLVNDALEIGVKKLERGIQ